VDIFATVLGQQRVPALRLDTICKVEDTLAERDLRRRSAMKTVKHILQDKGHNIWHITPDALVVDALKLMAEKEVGSLLVLDEGKLVGIISERDYARKVTLKGKSSLDTPVREIMTQRVISGHPCQGDYDPKGNFRTPRKYHRRMHGADYGQTYPTPSCSRR
jgi:CBS domain-containing protein